ncbi:YfiR family protein [Lysobacter sp. A3-1-A15]|uniref:YfiR family protein n=1 Tax=Novilysobacter viscosus TaxID=3098602 RepID=UPI002ED952CD
MIDLFRFTRAAPRPAHAAGARAAASRLGRARLGAASLMLGLAFAGRVDAQPTDSAEVQLEAAFLVNFVRFTQWPPPRFPSPDSPYVLTVLGDSEVVDAVREVANAAGEIQGRRIRVQQVTSLRQADATEVLRRSHVVFVHGSTSITPQQLLPRIDGASVLTVGAGHDFTRHGGMLGLSRSGRRMGFTANVAAIQASGLSVSAKVLKLATPQGRRQ